MATKAEIIARYGQAYYDACKARSREKAKAKYHATPREKRVKKTVSTEESRAKNAAYMKQWYHKNAEKVLANQAAALKRKMDAMNPTELAEFRAVKVARSAASRDKKREHYLKVARDGANARYAAKTPEERKAFNKKGWQQTKDRLSSDPALYQAHYESRKAYHAGWRERRREYVNERTRLWREVNPELAKAMVIAAMHKKRIVANRCSMLNKRVRRAAGKMDTHYVVWIRQQSCVDCGSTKNIEVGHIVPIKHGGGNENANLIPQCRSCNRRLSGRRHRLASVA